MPRRSLAGCWGLNQLSARGVTACVFAFLFPQNLSGRSSNGGIAESSGQMSAVSMNVREFACSEQRLGESCVRPPDYKTTWLSKQQKLLKTDLSLASVKQAAHTDTARMRKHIIALTVPPVYMRRTLDNHML